MPEDIGRLFLLQKADDVIWQSKQAEMAGDEGMVPAHTPGEIPDAPATHGFRLPLVLLSNQDRRTLESFLEYLMLADVPLGRDAAAAEALRARAEREPVLSVIEDLEKRSHECVHHSIFQAGGGVSSGVTYGTPYLTLPRTGGILVAPFPPGLLRYPLALMADGRSDMSDCLPAARQTV